MELKRSIKNKYYIFCISTVSICFVLGYVLLVSIDKIASPTIGELYISVYTVFTQFGMLIFPVLVIQEFSTDYKNKNILFYKLVGYNWWKYFLCKIGMILFWISLATMVGILIISILYNEYFYTIITMVYFESVIIYVVLISAMWGFLFKSVIGAYVLNFSFWLITMIGSIANQNLSFFARYDATNPVYIQLNKYFNTHNTEYLEIFGNGIYSLVILGSIMLIIFAFKRRWEKNGI